MNSGRAFAGSRSVPSLLVRPTGLWQSHCTAHSGEPPINKLIVLLTLGSAKFFLNFANASALWTRDAPLRGPDRFRLCWPVQQVCGKATAPHIIIWLNYWHFFSNWKTIRWTRIKWLQFIEWKRTIIYCSFFMSVFKNIWYWQFDKFIVYYLCWRFYEKRFIAVYRS